MRLVGKVRTACIVLRGYAGLNGRICRGCCFLNGFFLLSSRKIFNDAMKSVDAALKLTYILPRVGKRRAYSPVAQSAERVTVNH